MTKIEDFKDNKNVSDLFGLKTSNEESLNLSEYEQFGLNELEHGVEFTGKPNVIYFEPEEEENYTSFRVQLLNQKTKQLLNCYCNVPTSYPVIRKIFKANNFYKCSYDCIYTVVSKLNETAMLGEDGEPISCIESFNIEAFIDFLNSLEEMTIKTIPNGDYNSFIVKNFK